MSYAKAMKWHRKHPKGIPNLYLGFDSGSTPHDPSIAYASVHSLKHICPQCGNLQEDISFRDELICGHCQSHLQTSCDSCTIPFDDCLWCHLRLWKVATWEALT